eukprot:snap_masked-scaffold_6-processed-gene-14.29-mRNA-1 protein AED:1.00 eAED:1.00 QI:0/-1/0/0/-1/1/1/0/110
MQLDFSFNDFRTAEFRVEKQRSRWSQSANAILLGLVMKRKLFNWTLGDVDWNWISVQFAQKCRLYDITDGQERTNSAIRRHFKDLVRKNRQQTYYDFTVLYDFYQRHFAE